MENEKNDYKNDLSGNIVKPLRDKKGNIITNVQIVKGTYKFLKKLKESKNPKDNILFSKLVKNHNEVYDWCEQIANCSDDKTAQSLIEETLTTPCES